MIANEDLIPRPGSPLYNLNHTDENKRKKTLRRWRIINKYLVLPLYRLRIFPLFGFGRIFLILTTKGRVTGKKRKTPLEYHRIDQVITVFSSRGEETGWIYDFGNWRTWKTYKGITRWNYRINWISINISLLLNPGNLNITVIPGIKAIINYLPSAYNLDSLVMMQVEE